MTVQHKKIRRISFLTIANAYDDMGPQRVDCKRPESQEEPFRSRSDSRDFVTTDDGTRSCAQIPPIHI